MAELTIEEIVLRCVTYTGRCEEDILAAWARQCKRLRIVPIYGQLVNALRRLKREGKVAFIVVNGQKLLKKV